MKQLKNIFLFLSAFVPMFVLIFIKLVVDMINNNLSFNILNTLNFTTLIILILTGVFGLLWNIRTDNSAEEIFLISAQNITEKHFFGYFSLFVLFALQLDLSLVSGYCTFIVIMIFIAIVYMKNSLFYINPLLNLLGYNFYDVVFTSKENSQRRRAKIFYKGFLQENKYYHANLKNLNFTFIDKKSRN